MSWSVIIPSACSENLVRAVTSILDTHHGLNPDRIVVIDDGARSRAEEHLPAGITWIQGIKPFVFARNVNLGVRASSPNHTVIMGDDCRVRTLGAFDLLEDCLEDHPGVAVLSSGIEGLVGNIRQRRVPTLTFTEEEDVLAFVCVMVPRWAWRCVGPLDERFTGYGADDVDFCWRAIDAGYHLGVCHQTTVRHDGDRRSTFRKRKDFVDLWERNKRLFQEKWGVSSGGKRVAR